MQTLYFNDIIQKYVIAWNEAIHTAFFRRELMSIEDNVAECRFPVGN
jgi:hypothetical protein